MENENTFKANLELKLKNNNDCLCYKSNSVKLYNLSNASILFKSDKALSDFYKEIEYVNSLKNSHCYTSVFIETMKVFIEDIPDLDSEKWSILITLFLDSINHEFFVDRINHIGIVKDCKGEYNLDVLINTLFEILNENKISSANEYEEEIDLFSLLKGTNSERIYNILQEIFLELKKYMYTNYIYVDRINDKNQPSGSI